MTYQKPELNVLGNAETAILGNAKPSLMSPDGGNDYTQPAYEVDE